VFVSLHKTESQQLTNSLETWQTADISDRYQIKITFRK
jgi:hypothetical protein